MKVFISQPHGKEKLVAAFKSVGAEVVKHYVEDVELIIPTVDEELPFAAEMRDRLPVLVSSEFTIQMCRDKAEFSRFCKRHGFPTPHTMQEKVVIKPRFGKGSKGIQIIDRSYVVQEYIDWPEFSVDYFADQEGIPLSVILRYRRDVVNGESQKAELFEDALLSDTAKRLGTELGLVGPAVIQGFYKDGVFLFTEVNPRYGGGSTLTFDLFNSAKWLCENWQTTSLQKKPSTTQQPS